MTSTQEISSTQSENAQTTSSNTSINIEFDNLFFESELFKITLADPNERLPIAIIQDTTTSNLELIEPITTCTAHESGTVFYVHKRLLASLSLELAKHIDNRMKEGLSGGMALGEVDTSTMQWLLQWAYQGKCKFNTEFPDIATTLRCYTKLYVLGDRFNITALQNFSFNNICQIIPQLVTDVRTIDSSHSTPDPGVLLLKIMHYLADNIALFSDRLMEYLSKTIAFTLETIRVLPEFADLMQSHPQVAIAVCMSACAAMQLPDPWLSNALPPVTYQPIQPQFMKTSKPRLTKCKSGACNWFGTPFVRCEGCQATWEDQRTRYPKSQWRYYCCRACGKLETPAMLREVTKCLECKGESNMRVTRVWTHSI
ncbi:hypothetical protein EV426DRAFT_716344 [Tirmania nivea]|nr:hypothetical protein EV426DRAFT_716344 [Tirmania nivea]